MDRLAPTDEMLTRAFQLAYFIHGDKVTAVRIAADALAKLEVASAAQDKRLYYRLTGRSIPYRSRVRTKVSLGQLHLLQRLVYIESEPYEKQSEQRSSGVPIGEEDMIIHFIKHLAKITIKRNSFYVTLGLGRLLHNYSTAETMEIYNVVVQDPDRVRDDYYYRSRKGHLMREIKERFGSLLSVVRGQRGEERFESQDGPGRHSALVRECLNLFTPWATPCLVPSGINPTHNEIPRLSFSGSDPDEEHEIEVNRIHAVVHPDCFRRLTEALAFDSPEWRLEIPHFFLADDHRGDGGPRRDRRNPPPLSEEELIGIANNLAEQAARRKSVSAGLLRVIVDGAERARLDLIRGTSVSFELEESAELIEVTASDPGGDFLLAAHLLAHNEPEDESKPSKCLIILEGGQRLTLAVLPSKELHGGSIGSVVEVAYKETNPMRAASLALRQLRFQWSDRLTRLTYSSVVKPGLVLASLALLAVGLTLYLQSTKQTPERPQLAGNDQPAPKDEEQKPAPRQATIPPTSSPESPQQAKGPQRREQKTGRPAPKGAGVSRAVQVARNPASGEPDVARPETTVSEAEATRALRGERAAASLLAVKKVYVESRGRREVAESIRNILMNGFKASGRFTVTQVQEEADAALKVSARQAQAHPAKPGSQTKLRPDKRVSVVVRLVSADGYVIWPATGRITSREYLGDPEEAARRIVTDLLDDIKRLEHKK